MSALESRALGNGGSLPAGNYNYTSIVIPVGQTLSVGHVDFLVQGVVRATLHVRNAFGNVATASVEVVLERPAPPMEGAPTHAALTAREPVR